MQAKYTYSIIGVVSALLLTGCLGAVSNSSKTTSTADQNRTLGITIPGEPMTTDPTTSIETNGGAVITQTGEGIYRKNANNKIVAGRSSLLKTRPGIRLRFAKMHAGKMEPRSLHKIS